MKNIEYKKSRVKQPKIRFKNLKQALKYLDYWKRVLFLDDWIIKLSLMDTTNMKNLGENDFVLELKCSHIKLNNSSENDGIVKDCVEKVLVHELLHLKYNWIHYGLSDSIEKFFCENIEHQTLEEMAKSLIMVKYGLTFDWFKNFYPHQIIE